MQSAGIEEFLSPDGVAVIEWAEKAGCCKTQRTPDGKSIRAKFENRERIWNGRSLIIADRLYDDFGA